MCADCRVRLDTKEKPFTCFCGAAFTRRDLLKRHHRINHEENAESQSTVGLISPNSQEDRDAVEYHQKQQQQQQRQTELHTQPSENLQPVIQPQQYDAPLPTSSTAVEQWMGPQHTTYLAQNQPMIQPDGSQPALGGPAPVTHDADILEAAQLLLPGGYREPQPQPQTQPLPFFPEELNHFQEFTHFLDSIGLPAEWLPMSDAPPMVPQVVPNDVPQVRDQADQQHRTQMDRSRADSPFRSWLPSVPPGDQSIGTMSDYGMLWDNMLAS